MNPERWRRVEAIYHEASALPAERRTAFLGRACGSDHDLRDEVESLLAEERSAEAFLDTPAAVVGRAFEAGAGSAAQAPETERHFGSYVVLERLSEDGAGEVFRARDTRLRKDVAIRLLPSDFGADPERLWRFERTMRTLASIGHPNIAAIYGIKVLESGATALIQEWVPGGTLAAKLAKEPLSRVSALMFGSHLASALDAAHSRGLIHGSVRPAKVRLLGDVAKLADFGIAYRTLDPSDAWASPEQGSGHPADALSDIWAFGCLLREMLSGDRQASAPVDELMRRCLEADRSQRLQTLADASRLLTDAIAG